MGEYDTTALADDLDIYTVDGDITQFAFDRLYDDVVTDDATGVAIGVAVEEEGVERFAYIASLDDTPGPQCAHAYGAERSADGYTVTRFIDGERHPAYELADAPQFFMVEGTADLDPVPADDDPITMAEHVYEAASQLHDNRYLAAAALDDIAGSRLGDLNPGQLEFLSTLTSRLDLNATDSQPDADAVITEEKLQPLVNGLYEQDVDIPFATLIHTDVVEQQPLPADAPDGLSVPGSGDE